MQLPSPQVVIALVDLYETDRSNTHSGIMELAKTATENSLSIVTGIPSVASQLESICTLVKTRVNKAKTIEDWLNLIIFLGKQAEQAQFLKIAQKEQSLLCLTLHAIRDYIVSELKKSPEGQKALQERIIRLKSDEARLQRNIDECVEPEAEQTLTDKHGRSWEGLNNDLKEVLFELAYLGDKKSISKARQFGLLDYLIKLTEDDVKKMRDANLCENYNFVFQLCLQPDFCQVFYLFYYKCAPKKNFLDFEKEIRAKNEKQQKAVEDGLLYTIPPTPPAKSSQPPTILSTPPNNSSQQPTVPTKQTMEEKVIIPPTVSSTPPNNSHQQIAETLQVKKTEVKNTIPSPSPSKSSQESTDSTQAKIVTASQPTVDTTASLTSKSTQASQSGAFSTTGSLATKKSKNAKNDQSSLTSHQLNK